MESVNVYMKLQKLFIDNDEDLPVDEIVKFIKVNNLFCNKMKSLSTMRLIASIIYSNPTLLDQTIQILTAIDKINIDLDLLTYYTGNSEIEDRSMVIYILLLLSKQVKFGEIHIRLSLKQMTIINPVYTCKFPNYPGLTYIDDFVFIVNFTDDEKIKIRNKLHSCHPIVQSIIDDDIDLLIELLSTKQFGINDEIPKSIFEIHRILIKAIPIQYAAFLGSINCFKYLLLNSDFVDYEQLMKYAIIGGNNEIIHIVEEHCEISDFDYSYKQKLLNLAILYMRNDIVQYLLNNYEITINCDCYINCIYSSNYEALAIFQEYQENKSGINSTDEFHNYVKFMISIFDIIEAKYIRSLVSDIRHSAYNGEKFDVLDFIIKHKLIDNESKEILEPISIALNYNSEQVINDFHNFSQDQRYEYDDYDYDFDFDFGYWEDFYKDWHDFWDDNRDKNNHAKKYIYRSIKKKSNKNSIDKNSTNENKKKYLKKNMKLYIKEYFKNNETFY